MAKKIGFLLFPGFEVLDVYGPLTVFASPKLQGAYQPIIVAECAGPIEASNGISTLASESFSKCTSLDILLVPGGSGARKEIHNEKLLSFILQNTPVGDQGKFLLTVCTGAALAAKAGSLKGKQATTNKASWAWATAQSDNTIRWLKTARWVEDGQIWTSAGVSAGIDMALAFIAKHHGKEVAHNVAAYAEYNGDYSDSRNDPWGKLIDTAN